MADAQQNDDVVTETTSTKMTSTDGVNALQAIIERHVALIDGLKEKVHTLSDSMKSILDNDTELADSEQEAKEATNKIKQRKSSLTQSPEYRELLAKAGEMKDELKELEEALNSHLISYFQQTGVKTIDTSDGKQREFKVIARILPKKGEK